MIATYGHQVLSSFLLWLDHTICSQGQAFVNYSGNFYNISGSYANYYTFGAPFNQLIADSSISGANICTGVYLNNKLISTGISGLVDINYKAGHIYFNNDVRRYPISGYYSVKEFNINLTDRQDDVLLFKTKYSYKPKSPQLLSGVNDEHIIYPAILVRQDGSSADPFAFGGQEWDTMNVRCIILADSLFNLHGIQSILKDSIRTPIALFSAADQPYNSLGGLKSGVYNYTGMAYTRIQDQNFVFIENVFCPKAGQRRSVMPDTFNYDVFFNFVDFELSKVRKIRN